MRGFKNFKDSDARRPSIHFLFYDFGLPIKAKHSSLDEQNYLALVK